MSVAPLLLFLGIGLVFCDISTTCDKKCSEKYSEEQLTACEKGCDIREENNTPFGFISCFSECQINYGNSSTQEEACHFACQLPRKSSVMMTMVNDNGKQRWKVVEQHDDNEPIVRYEETDENLPLSSILLKPQNVNGGILSLRRSDDSSSEESDDFQKMRVVHERMNEMMENFARQFVEGLRRQAQADAEDSDEGAISRPQGHSPWSDDDVLVGNIASDGQPIIVSETVHQPKKGISVELRRSQRPRLVMLFHWALIGVGIVALFTALFAVIAFLRNLRATSYRRMAGEGTTPVLARIHPVGPVPVKKVPEEGWIDTSPSGVPPPAYDQVSVHKSPIDESSDKP